MSAAVSRPSVAALFRSLQRALGADAAARELRWMNESAGQPSPASVAGSPLTLEDMLARRVRGEPLQYILGSQPFGPLNLLTRPPVLIPRPETEDWTIRLLERLSPSRDSPLSILDLCSGSGCIPLLLCHLLPPGTAHAIGVDISEVAVQLAKDNAALCNIAVPENALSTSAKRRQWGYNTFAPLLASVGDPALSSLLSPHSPFDVVTSNPPYISKGDYDKLPASVKHYEDPRALLGDPDAESGEGRGLTFYRAIAELLSRRSPRLVKDNGVVALEVGEGQAQDVARILDQKACIQDIEIWRDPWDKERVVFGRT